MLKEDQDPCEDYDSEEDKCGAFDEFESKVMGIDDLDDVSSVDFETYVKLCENR